MARSNEVILGFSISPTHLGAVSLSATDFSILFQIEQPLPSAILSHDAKRLLDPNTLLPYLHDVFLHLNDPGPGTPVYLSVYTPALGTKRLPSDEVSQWATKITVADPNPRSDELDKKLLQSSKLFQQNGTCTLAYGIMPHSIISSYQDLFSQLGYPLHGVDLIPFAVLRSMAASGVLDTLVQTIGKQALWGCFGTCGSQTWCTVWQGNQLLLLDHMTTPSNKKNWERRLQECVERVNMGRIHIWFAWQEHHLEVPIDPLKLRLNAPIRPAILGPFYGFPNHQPSFPALGSALRSTILFPLAWDFLTEAPPIVDDLGLPSIGHPLDGSAALASPKPKKSLLKALFRLSCFGFGLILLATAILWGHNTAVGWALQQKQGKAAAVLNHVLTQNQGYQAALTWITQNTPDGIQLNQIALHPDQTFRLAGHAYEASQVQAFQLALGQKNPQVRVSLSQVALKMQADSPEQLVRFELTGTIVDSKQPPRTSKS